jgi:hypothetical protein
MQFRLSKSEPIIQNENDFTTGVASLNVWAAKMESINLASMTKRITKLGYIMHIKDDLASAFGITFYDSIPVLIIPKELRSWFGFVPWRSVVNTADRILLITDLNQARFSLSFPFNFAIRRLFNVNQTSLFYIQVGDELDLNSLIAVNFHSDGNLICKESYYESF